MLQSHFRKDLPNRLDDARMRRLTRPLDVNVKLATDPRRPLGKHDNAIGKLR
jgi:hypothetical protein